VEDAKVMHAINIDIVNGIARPNDFCNEDNNPEEEFGNSDESDNSQEDSDTEEEDNSGQE
jgi:hypothetical protein